MITGSADTQPIGIQAKQSVEKLSEDLGDTTLSSSPPQEEFISDTFEGGEGMLFICLAREINSNMYPHLHI